MKLGNKKLIRKQMYDYSLRVTEICFICYSKPEAAEEDCTLCKGVAIRNRAYLGAFPKECAYCKVEISDKMDFKKNHGQCCLKLEPTEDVFKDFNI